MVRVRCDCPSEVSSTVVDTLKIVVELQRENTGVMAYHFARPDSKRPNHFEFTELYANETTFLRHSTDSDFTAAFQKVFIPEHKIQSVAYCYGPGFVGKVEEMCNAMMKYRAPKTTAGFVLNQKWDMKTMDGGGEDKAILLIAQFVPRREKPVKFLSSCHNCPKTQTVVFWCAMEVSQKRRKNRIPLSS